MNNTILESRINKLDTLEIANFFITSAKREDYDLNLDNLKNIIYMASGWFSTFSKEPLLNESFTIDQDNVNLLSLSKIFSDKIIIKQKIRIKFISSNVYTGYIPYPLDFNINMFLNRVWALYKDHDESDFEIYTKSEHSPYSKLIKSKRLEENLVITNHMIQKQFSSYVSK